MSRMEIYGVKADGSIESKFALGNSWLGAMLVWTQLGNKYLGKYDYIAEGDKREALRRQGKDPDKELGEYDPMGVTRVWKLHSSEKLTDAEWCVLVCTFDGCIVLKDQFEHVAKCFREFHQQFPTSHYAACAEAIEKLRDEGYEGYCVNATSVNQNPWWVYPTREEREKLPPDDDGEGRPYDLNIDKKHWFFDPADRAKEIAKAQAEGASP
jgi:hypothetical protein